MASNGLKLMDYLHKLAPSMFNSSDTLRSSISTTNGRPNIMGAMEYVKRMSCEMLDCHDKKIPQPMHDLYKALLFSDQKEMSFAMSVIFRHYNRSYAPLTFYKDVAKFTSSLASSKISVLLPFARGVNALDISEHDVFNDMLYSLNGDDIIGQMDNSIEHPIVRMMGSLLLETLREYAGNTNRNLFKEHTTYDSTDERMIEHYVRIHRGKEKTDRAFNSAVEKISTVAAEGNNPISTSIESPLRQTSPLLARNSDFFETIESVAANSTICRI